MKLRILSITTIVGFLIINALIFSRYQISLYSTANDALLTAEVKSAFFLHPHTPAREIHVVTNHGKVILSGTVDNKEEFQLAKFISATTPGVLSVNANALRVKSQSSYS